MVPKESKLFMTEFGKPYLFPLKGVGTSQGVTMTKRVEDSVKSECQSVMD